MNQKQIFSCKRGRSDLKNTSDLDLHFRDGMQDWSYEVADEK